MDSGQRVFSRRSVPKQGETNREPVAWMRGHVVEATPVSGADEHARVAVYAVYAGKRRASAGQAHVKEIVFFCFRLRD